MRLDMKYFKKKVLLYNYVIYPNDILNVIIYIKILINIDFY